MIRKLLVAGALVAGVIALGAGPAFAHVEIEREVSNDLIFGTFRCDPARFDVTVKAGVLTLRGTPESAVTGHEILAAARHVEGVVAVRDRLMYPLVMTAASDPPPY